MNILVINPNTSAEMTADIADTINSMAISAKVDAVSSVFGSMSIESHIDEVYGAVGVLEVITKYKEQYDAFVIACFSDPGLYAARELTDKPVIGIGEASMLIACSLGWKFSLIGTVERDVAHLSHLTERYGLDERCASIRVAGCKVADFIYESKRKYIIEKIIDEGVRAIEEDKAEVLCLACAGMTGINEILKKELNVPIVDAVTAGVGWAILQLTLSLKHSQCRFLKPNPGKLFKESTYDSDTKSFLIAPNTIYNMWS